MVHDTITYDKPNWYYSPGALGKKWGKCYKAEFLHIGQEYHPNQHIKSPKKSNWSFLQKSLMNVSEIGHK